MKNNSIHLSGENLGSHQENTGDCRAKFQAALAAIQYSNRLLNMSIESRRWDTLEDRYIAARIADLKMARITQEYLGHLEFRG